jgi:hypothetical protein
MLLTLLIVPSICFSFELKIFGDSTTSKVKYIITDYFIKENKESTLRFYENSLNVLAEPQNKFGSFNAVLRISPVGRLLTLSMKEISGIDSLTIASIDSTIKTWDYSGINSDYERIEIDCAFALNNEKDISDIKAKIAKISKQIKTKKRLRGVGIGAAGVAGFALISLVLYGIYSVFIAFFSGFS